MKLTTIKLLLLLTTFLLLVSCGGAGGGSGTPEDVDGDGVSNEQDAFPTDPTETSDTDGDGIGDNADPDADGNGILDELERDRDGDGVANDIDAFPDDPSETSDLDGDGIGDNSDADRDGDNFSNTDEDAADTNPDDASDFPDTVAPVITLNSTASVTTDESLYTVRGRVVDTEQPYSGVDTIQILSDRFASTQFTGTYDSATSEFSIEVPLQTRSNILTIVARDNSANESQIALTIERTAPFYFQNVTPINGAIVDADSVTIQGEILTELALADIIFRVNGSRLNLVPTATANVFSFSFPDFPLVLGANTIEFSLQSTTGTNRQNWLINNVPEDERDIAPPSITLRSPSSGATINQDSFRVAALVESSAGPLSVNFNGKQVVDPADNIVRYDLSELVQFNSSESTSITIEAIDNLGRTANLSTSFNNDSQAPIITLDNNLQIAPVTNSVTQSPYRLRGTVSDDNLSSLLFNDQSVSLLPGGDQNTFTFFVDIPIAIGEILPINISAFDSSGNSTAVEYVLENTATAEITAVLPTENTNLVSSGDPIPLQIVARGTNLAGGETVVAYPENSSNPTQLDINGTLASGSINLPPTTGEQDIIIELRDTSGALLSTDQITVNVNNSDDITVELLRIEPTNNAQFIEPNTAIELYFNRDIDINLLNVTVRETLNGKTYVNNDPLGVDFTEAEGFTLQEVNRNLDPVIGQLELSPGGASASFSASNNFGFNADIFVEVSYNGEELSRSTFKVRELPTFINGAVADQFGQPLIGIEVAIPELDRKTTTNGDGAFAFGYQEGGQQVIPSGSYQLVINKDFRNPRFGVLQLDVSIQRNYPNQLTRYVLQELDRSLPFQNLISGNLNNLAAGDLLLDLSGARALFANGRTSGSIHTQFIPFEHISAPLWPAAAPHWIFSIQPKGIEVEGEVSINIEIPQLFGSYDYISTDVYTHVLLLGYSIDKNVIEPIGVGRIQGTRIISEGEVNLTSLDYIGYAQLNPDLNEILQQYAQGDLSLAQLLAALPRQ